MSKLSKFALLCVVVPVIMAVFLGCANDTVIPPDPLVGPPYHTSEYDKADKASAKEFFLAYSREDRVSLCRIFWEKDDESFFTFINNGIKNSSVTWALVDLLWYECSNDYFE